ncbi:MAG TPA: hypothetical protein VJ255_15375 [Candidatus Acidoferrum sp.]|jgi:hypothetical protein|nr:hypothetical protein [Candidatus Acidoferrum sp.]
MRQPRITDEMFATVPALIARGLTKAEIAAQFGVMPSSLQVMCSQRRISLRKGGPLLKRLTLVYEELPLSDGVLKSLREAAQAMGRPTARLASDLLEKIARDGLYKAVLDEEAQPAQ